MILFLTIPFVIAMALAFGWKCVYNNRRKKAIFVDHTHENIWNGVGFFSAIIFCAIVTAYANGRLPHDKLTKEMEIINQYK